MRFALIFSLSAITTYTFGIGELSVFVTTSDENEIYFRVQCQASLPDYESPLYVTLMKEGLEEPIISAVFYSSLGASNANISNENTASNTSCYKPNASIPCFNNYQMKVNNNFWWCGYLADFCNLHADNAFQFFIFWGSTVWFIHWGKYICKIEQKGTILEDYIQNNGMSGKGDTSICLRRQEQI